MLAIGGMDLRNILPNQHGRAVGAQEGDRIHEGIEPPERPGLIEEQHDLVARPLRAFLAHEGVQRAARHDAQPAAIGEKLLLIDAEVKRGDFLRVQVFELEGAARGESPRWRAFGPGFGGLLQVRQDGRELRLEALAIAHGAQEP